MDESISKKELRKQKKEAYKALAGVKYRDMTDEQKAIYKSHEIKYWVTFATVLIILYLILTFVVQIHPIFVHGESMYPTYDDGNLTLSVNMFYEPKNGDVIVFKCDGLNENLIKRVIATEGQTVYIDYGTSTVYVDNEPVNEPYINEKEMVYTPNQHTTQNPCKVPEGYIFVMGDNRNHSLDSRSSEVGLVNKDDIVGKVVFGSKGKS